MADEFYLINADEPRSFKRRKLVVARQNVRFGKQTGVIVTIDPPLDNLIGGPLATALLLPRHVGRSLDELREGRPVHVYVCRVLDKAGEAVGELTRQDVSIVIWGLVGTSPTLGAADIFR